MPIGEPNEHYCIIKAGSQDEAISRAVFDLHKPSELRNATKLLCHGDLVAMNNAREIVGDD